MTDAVPDAASDGTSPGPPRTRVTIVVSPRERYGVARRCLEDLYRHTPEPFDLVYVTSAAPRALADWLDAEAVRRGFRHIREARQITPNEARNRGARLATTPYIVFVDNDVVYTPGWLDRLVACADETGAAVVAPLTCHGQPEHTTIHQAGGTFASDLPAFFAAPHGERNIDEVMHLQGVKVADVALERSPTQCCEFHCVLVNRKSLEEIGGLDENMLATKEHIDFCMDILSRGGQVMLEPTSVVTYLFPSRQAPMQPGDWPYFLVRWSPEWQQRSLQHLRAKWGLKSEAYFQDRAERLYWRHYEGVVKPQVRRIPIVRNVPLLSSLASRAIGRVTRMASRSLTAKADRQRQRSA